MSVQAYDKETIDALYAENKRLQTELDNEQASGIHTCNAHCQRVECVQRKEIERLRDALDHYGKHDDYCNIGRHGQKCDCGFDETIGALEAEDATPKLRKDKT